MSDEGGAGIVRILARHDEVEVSLVLDPPLPPLEGLDDGTTATGTWGVTIDGAPITGGTWHVTRRGALVEIVLEVTRRWKPPAELPLLMRVVTRVVPTFRQWPTSYRWTVQVDLATHPATIASQWERTGSDRGEAYRRATRS